MVVVVENHVWWWRTMRGGGEPCVVVVVESDWALPPGAGARLGGLDFSPCLEIFVRMEAMWGPNRDQAGATGFGDGQTKQNHWQVCGSIHVGDWDLPCSICAAASVRRTVCSRCRGRRCGMAHGQESWESPTGGQEKGGGLHHAARPCGELHGVGD